MIIVRADTRHATCTSDDAITTGSVGIQVKFMLSGQFNGLSAVAVFRSTGASVDVALMSNTCVVPPEVLRASGVPLYIGVYARNSEGTVVIPTVWTATKEIQPGTRPSGVNPSEPTPDWTAQVQLAAQEAVQTSEQAIENSERAIEIAGGAQAAADDARQSADEAAQSATAAAASEAAAREVEESIPADYTALSEDVSELKSQFNNVARIGKNIFNAIWINGISLDENGNETASVRNATSSAFPVEPTTTYTAKCYGSSLTFTNLYAVYFNNVGERLGNISVTGQTLTFTTPANCAFVRLVTFQSAATGVGLVPDYTQVELGALATEYEHFGYYYIKDDAIITDKLLRTAGAPADAKATGVFKNVVGTYLVADNVIWNDTKVEVTQNGRYAQVILHTETNIASGDVYTFTADSVENATASQPFAVYIKKADNSNVRTALGAESISVRITNDDISSGATNVLFVFYPAQGIALSTPATLSNPVIYKGADLEYNYSAKLDKHIVDASGGLLAYNPFLYNEDSVSVSGTGSYVFKNIYTMNGVSEGETYSIEVDRAQGTTYNHVVQAREYSGTTSVYVNSSPTDQTENIKLTFKAHATTDNITFVLYASASGAVDATFTGVRIYKGDQPAVYLNECVKVGGGNIPSYYHDNNYLENKVEFIRNLMKQTANDGDAFYFVTDEHWDLNAGRSPYLISFLEKQLHIEKLFQGGDTASDGNGTDFIHALNTAFRGHVLNVVGNHEYFALRKDPEIAYMLNQYNNGMMYGNAGRNYYYIDNNYQKVRYVVLNAYSEGATSSAAGNGYEEAQLNWLTNTALNVESGWTIVIITHALYYINISTDEIEDYITSAVEAIDSYSGDGEIACIIQGHTHRDRITHTPGGIPVIITTCDKNIPWTDPTTGLQDLNVPRTVGTINEQAFDVFVLDKKNKKITAVRIGAKALNGVDDAPGSGVEYREITYGS